MLTNAGALNPRGLAEAVVALLAQQGISLKVAWVEGDNIIDRLDELAAKGEKFTHLEGEDRPLSSWGEKPLTANAYVGARGVHAALEAGADIVISGRCTDASPIIGAAAWWHGWKWDNYDALAGALVAGHCIVSAARGAWHARERGGIHPRVPPEALAGPGPETELTCRSAART